MRTRLAPLLLALSLLLAVPAAVTGQGGTVSSAYMETFTGMPRSPAAYRPPGWDVQIHSRDLGTWTDLEPMLADHGPACEGPPAQHALDGDYPASVFQCHDHVMTALQAGGYGVIYLTPPALLDWSAGTATLQWDMSTRRTSERDWVDVWISPPADHLALPLDDWLPDLAGPPRNAIHLKEGGGSFSVAVVTDGVSQAPPAAWWLSYDSVLTPDAARRDTFRVEVSRTHLKLGLPAYNLWWVDTDLPDLGWDQGVVQLGHHSYNPAKDCTPTATFLCRSNTWHWDAVSLSPSVPLTITSLSPRQLSDQAPGGWPFPAPVPAGTTLQVSANNAPGDVAQLDLSWDGGATWQTVGPQPTGALVGHDLHSARSYWVPVPAGAAAVQVRGQGGYWGGAWQAKDASLWQLSAADVPPTPIPPTPLPSPTAGATPTAPPPPTPEATPTFLPAATVGASPTLVPTRTPLPQATATATVGPLPGPNPSRPCQVPRARFGVVTWDDLPTSQCR